MGLRLTVQVQLVLQALLHDPAREMYGLEREGWVTSRWEDVDPRAEKRPARRYYRLTAGGAVQASAALAGASRPRDSALRRLAGEVASHDARH
jgi:PadR family transcriptional regulator PadR